MDRYAVFGHPISHSKSPRIHALFAAQTGQELEYTARDVPPEAFEAEVLRFLEDNGRGFNCTVPLKELAFHHADSLSERATQAKAVNTLALRVDGTLFGDNTDGVGLIRDLTRNLSLELAGRRILLLGAGGASRGILGPLLDERPARVAIANRTASKAEQLAAEFNTRGPVEGGSLHDFLGDRFDLVINATAASLFGQRPDLPASILADGGACYDLAYANEPTAFVRFGQEIGATVSVDGIGMLVEQAAEAFTLWRGIRPATGPVIATLAAERSQAG